MEYIIGSLLLMLSLIWKYVLPALGIAVAIFLFPRMAKEILQKIIWEEIERYEKVKEMRKSDS